jgi:hypothetical protein
VTIKKCDICSKLESKKVIIKEYSIYNKLISSIYEYNGFYFKDLCNECADEIYKVENDCMERVNKIMLKKKKLPITRKPDIKPTARPIKIDKVVIKEKI